MPSPIVRLLLGFTLILGAAPLPARPAAPDACVPPITISTNTSWLLASSPYLVCTVTVTAGATLTVAPGVLVQFQAGVASKLNIAGALNALGTVTQPITFTGVITTAGSWTGLSAVGVITPAQVSLDYVTLDYGGLAGSYGAAVYADQAAITITHSLIRHSAGNGVYVSISARLDAHATNFVSNGQNAIQLNQPSTSLLMTELTASGNGTDGVAVVGSAVFHGQQRWTAPGLPFFIDGPVRTDLGDVLTIDPGNTLVFTTAGWLYDRGGMNIVGTPSQPITLTGRTQTAGSWLGLFIDGGLHQALAQLDYVTIEYGGSSAANIHVANGQLLARHSLIRYSLKDGVRFDSNWGGSILESQIVSNTLYGVFNSTPQRPVLATNNWWGDPAGPQSDVLACNPGGSGSKVTAGVFFQPVLTNTTATVPFALSNAPIITLTPRRWFAPADGVSKIYFDITVRDGNGRPLPGRTVQLNTSFGQVTAGGTTDQDGHTLAYLTSPSVGDAAVTGALTVVGCEGYLAPETKVTFTPPVNVTDLLPNAAAPYFDGDLTVSPLPVLTGISTTISAKLTNPLTVPITVDVSFGFAQSGIGLVFGPIKDLNSQVIPANGSVTLSAAFAPVVSGHYCVQVAYTLIAVGPVGLLAPQGSTRQLKQFNLNVQQGPLGPPATKDRLNKADKAFSLVSKLPSGPTQIQKGIIGRWWSWAKQAASDISQGLGGDPPRQDYNQVTLPVRHPLPPVQSSVDIPLARATALNAVNAALTAIEANGTAATTAMDRYGGASEANNLQWASEQANALLYYEQQLGTALLAYADAVDTFVQVLQTETETQTTVSASEVISYQQRLVNPGFTVQEIADAHLVGLTDAQIEAQRQAIIAADPNAVAGNWLTKYADEAAASRALGNVLLFPPTFHPGFSVSGGAGLAPATTSGNSMAQVFNSVSTIQLRNPLTSTTLIDVKARRIDLPGDWAVEVSPAQISLAFSQTTTVTVRVLAGSPVSQGTSPRVAVEGYAGSLLLGGVVIDIVVPNYVLFDGRLRLYLPVLRR